MRSHPFPDGSLVLTYLDHRPPDSRGEYVGKKVVGIIESYIREYNPADSYYLIFINERIQARDRSDVWFVS